MKLEDGSVFVGKLTTTGRQSGQPRTVELRLVYTGGRFYASSSKVEGKHWCRNMINDPAVDVSVGSDRYRCFAERVTDERLRRHVLGLRDSSPLTGRVVFEMTPR